MSLNSTLITSRLLTRPSALLVISSVGIGGTPIVTGQMANSVALVAFRSTWTIVCRPSQCFASCSLVVVVVVVSSECSLRKHPPAQQSQFLKALDLVVAEATLDVLNINKKKLLTFPTLLTQEQPKATFNVSSSRVMQAAKERWAGEMLARDLFVQTMVKEMTKDASKSSKPRSQGLISRDFKLCSRAGEGKTDYRARVRIKIIGRFFFSPEMGIGSLGDGIEFADQELKITHEKSNKNDTQEASEDEGTKTLREKQVQFTTEATIIEVSDAKGWIVIDDGTSTATVTCFSLEAHTFVPECNKVVNVVEDKDTCHVSDALKQVENNTYIFHYHIGKGAKPGDPDFNLDASFKSATQLILIRDNVVICKKQKIGIANKLQGGKDRSRENEWMMIELYRFLHQNEDVVFEFLLECFLSSHCGDGAIYVESIEFRAIGKVKHDETGKLMEVPCVMKSNFILDQLQQLPTKFKRIFNYTNYDKLGKVNGKKLFMISAKTALHKSSNVNIFSSMPSAHSRFRKVIELLPQQVFHINCTIKSQMLSPDTEYVCYLVFKLSENCQGLHCPVKVRDILHQENNEAEFVYSITPSPLNVHDITKFPKQREDGWMEIQLCNFNSTRKFKDGSFSINMKFTSLEGIMSGLIVCGLEFRPAVKVKLAGLQLISGFFKD
ncbi:kinase-like domain, phloem protein 2-like protein [Tanacetum coccineum]